jgi:hypothetical protein
VTDAYLRPTDILISPDVRDFAMGQQIPYSSNMQEGISVRSGKVSDEVPISELYNQIGMELVKLINRDDTILPYCAKQFDLLAVAAFKVLINEGKLWILGSNGCMIKRKSYTASENSLDLPRESSPSSKYKDLSKEVSN